MLPRGVRVGNQSNTVCYFDLRGLRHRLSATPLTEIKVSCCQDGQSVQLTVSDNGSGIPPEIMDEIYNPFFTTKKKREGNGLGLYIVYNEVQKMGGEIKAESDVGRGTTFYIRIPIENGGRQDEQKRTQSTGSR